jgi:ribonuclease HI
MPITKLFTDGSTLNNQKSKSGCSYGGYGGYILYSNSEEQVYSNPLEGDKITNQVAELMALKCGLEIVILLQRHTFKIVCNYFDLPIQEQSFRFPATPTPGPHGTGRRPGVE